MHTCTVNHENERAIFSRFQRKEDQIAGIKFHIMLSFIVSIMRLPVFVEIKWEVILIKHLEMIKIIATSELNLQHRATGT